MTLNDEKENNTQIMNNEHSTPKSSFNGSISNNISTSSNDPDYSSNIKDKTKKTKSNFVFINFYVDLISYLLIIAVIYSSYLMFVELPNHVKKIKSYNLDYKFPSPYDMISTIYIFIAIFLIHKIFNYFSVNKLEKLLSKRYDKEEIIIYKNKVSTNIIKFFLYSSSTILGYFALKELNCFPWTLGGKGEFKNAYAAGFPNYLFFEKPYLLDFYYNFNLAFALFDTYILLTYPLQSDFLLMVLHHSVTFNLVVFSFLVNFSGAGSIVYFVHYCGDILSMLVRIFIHINNWEVICCYLTMLFLVVFIYTRLFVFGDIIYQTYSFMLFEDYSIYSLYLCSCLAVLMILNIIWIVLISKKVINYLITGKVEEIYKIKKANESKKEL